MMELLILQCVAHLLADFTFQSQKWCDKKEQKIISKEHVYHALVVFTFSWIFSLHVSFWWASLLIAISHFGLDVLKSFLYKQNIGHKYLFFIDQAFHFGIITLAVYLFSKTGYHPMPVTASTAFIIFALAACTKPSNIFIKKFMESRDIIHVHESKDENDLLKAGRVIGSLERLISFILILFNQFAAVGFIIAAKSILRFRDTQTAKTEYLLIGTLLSFGIAVTLGILYSFI